ncbi:MAG: DUF3592 domain-containing protein [Lachnospiraceae bacterium]
MNTGKKIGGIIMTAIGGIFLFVAIIFAFAFLVVGGAMGNAKDQTRAEMEEFADRAIETQGEIIDADGSTTVEYYSETDDSYYEVTFSVSNSSFREGDLITVYYDKDNPGTCMAPDLVEDTYDTLSTVFSGVGAGLGIFFGIIGLGLLIGGIILIRKSKPSYEN